MWADAIHVAAGSRHRLASGDQPTAQEEGNFFFKLHVTGKNWEEFRNCIRLTREIFAQDGFQTLQFNTRRPPGADLQKRWTKLDAFYRDMPKASYHPCGTAAWARVNRRPVVDRSGRGDRRRGEAAQSDRAHSSFQSAINGTQLCRKSPCSDRTGRGETSSDLTCAWAQTPHIRPA